MNNTSETPNIPSTARSIDELLSPFEPTTTSENLIEILNCIFHEYEAKYYDSKHPEIFQRLNGIWQEMLIISATDTKLNILDFGCGTGFAAEQYLKSKTNPHSRITCFDPSAAMLNKCESRLRSQFPTADIQFTNDLNAIKQIAPFDLILTNAVMHHLWSINDTIALFTEWLPTGGRWIAGHEPSNRFYLNDDCHEELMRYKIEYRWRRFLSVRNIVFGIGFNPAIATARQAYKMRYFRKRPTARAIGLTVDCGVAHSRDEALSGRGFNFNDICERWGDVLELRWVKSYNFMGPHPEVTLPKKWKEKCESLAEKHPHDGANASAVWIRR